MMSDATPERCVWIPQFGGSRWLVPKCTPEVIVDTAPLALTRTRLDKFKGCPYCLKPIEVQE